MVYLRNIYSEYLNIAINDIKKIYLKNININSSQFLQELFNKIYKIIQQ